MCGRACREHEVPITSITNGIHTKTWMAPEFGALYDKYLPGLGGASHGRRISGARCIDIPDEDIWATHQQLKQRLDRFRPRARAHAADAPRREPGEDPRASRAAESRSPDDRLRAPLRDLQARDAALQRSASACTDCSTNTERPVQFVFAGKAHPKDEPGKQFIQEVYQFTRMPEFENRIVFVEDYDHYVGRRLYQGVRSVAEQSAPSARSQRHQRHEAAAERRPEPQRARWLVVRRLRRQERLGDRRGDPREHRAARTRVRGRRRCREPLPHPRDADRAALLRQAGRPPAARVDSAHARIDPHACCRSSTRTAW